MTEFTAAEICEWILDRGEAASNDGVDAAERAVQTLGGALAELVGPGGAQAILQAAVKKARAEHQILANTSVEWGSSLHLKNLRGEGWGFETAAVRSGAAALLTWTVRLLVELIGNELTSGLLRNCWPESQIERISLDPIGDADGFE